MMLLMMIVMMSDEILRSLFLNMQVFDYIYHLNAQTPSGEAAFKTLAGPYGFAKDPVITKIDKLDADVPITFLYGAKSWITSDSGGLASNQVFRKKLMKMRLAKVI